MKRVRGVRKEEDTFQKKDGIFICVLFFNVFYIFVCYPKRSHPKSLNTNRKPQKG